LSLDACLGKLRYVKYGDEVRADDINTKVECLRALSSMFRQLGVNDPLVDELDAVLSIIPYVSSGDVIQPEHHNYIVDALMKVRDILSKMESYYISQVNQLIDIINYMSSTLQPWGTLTFGYGMSYWFANPYIPGADSLRLPPHYTLSLIDASTYGAGPYSGLNIEYLATK
jgi:hypothetical protein